MATRPDVCSKHLKTYFWMKDPIGWWSMVTRIHARRGIGRRQDAHPDSHRTRLRSFDRRMAEEINRVIPDHLSTLLFAPTSDAVRNLAAEGIVPPAVLRVGDACCTPSECLALGRRREARSSIA